MMRFMIFTLVLAASPAWALVPQTALPRPIACGAAVTRVATTERPDAYCPQWLSTGGVIPRQSIHRS